VGWISNTGQLWLDIEKGQQRGEPAPLQTNTKKQLQKKAALLFINSA